MKEILVFIVLGLGSSAFIAGLGLCLTISYRGSGTVNLATGATAALAAYVYYGLRVEGELVLPPLPFLADRMSVGGVMSAPLAIVIALGMAMLVGTLFDVLVIRRLRDAPPLSRLIASLGLLLLLQSWMLVRFGVDGLASPPVLSQSPVNVLGTPLPSDRVVLAAIVAVVALGLTMGYGRSRFGIATTAAAENEAGAMRFGLSPRRLSLINSVLAALLAGLLGVVFAAMSQLDNVTLTYAVIPALAAALIGRFRSFVMVAAAGFGLGVLNSVVQWSQGQSWFPTAGGLPLSGAADLLAFVIIAVVVFTRDDAIPARGTVTEASLPPSPAPRNVGRTALVLALVTVVGLQVLPADLRQGLITSIIGATVCLALVVITGFMGQASLLHAGLAGVAALVVTKLGASGGLPFPLAPLLAVLAAVSVGLVGALPALRVRGVQLAIVTMSGALALSSVLLNNTQIGFDPITSDVVTPRVFGYDLGPSNTALTFASGSPGALFGMFCLALCGALMLLMVALRRGKLGKRMLAVRSNERAAAAAGIDARAVKLAAYALSSAIAGVGGVLLSYNYGTSAASNYNITIALAFIGFAYLGGISTIKGAIIGGLVVTQSIVVQLLNNIIGLSPNSTLVLASFVLLVTIVANPGGIALAPPPWRPILRAVRRRSTPSSAPTGPLSSPATIDRTKVAR